MADEPIHPDVELGLPDLGQEGNEARATVTDDIAEAAGATLPKPEGEEAAAPAETVTQETPPAKPAEAKPAEQPAAAQPVTDKVPDTWRPMAKAEWEKVPPVVRQEIMKREGDVAKLVADTKTDVAISSEMKRMFAPFAPVLQKYNVEPISHMEGLLRGHYTLMFGSDADKAQVMRGLARDAGIDLAKLVDPNAPASAAANPEFVSALRERDEKLATLERTLTGVTTEFQRQRANELSRDVLAFAQTHPSFWDVADDMTALINAGATKSLQEAYEIAELRNPVTRARRLDAEREETAKAQAAKDAEKTGKAKAASATNVRSRGNARAAAPEESLDDTIRNGLAAIRARQAH